MVIYEGENLLLHLYMTPLFCLKKFYIVRSTDESPTKLEDNEYAAEPDDIDHLPYNCQDIVALGLYFFLIFIFYFAYIF